MKKISFFNDSSIYSPRSITLLFLFWITSQSIFSMEPEESKKELITKKEEKKLKKSEPLASAKTAFKELKLKSLSLWKSITKTKQRPDQPVPSNEPLWIWPLPQDLTVEIIKMVIDVRDKEKLKASAHTILNLASTNKAFNNILNNPRVMKTLLKSVSIVNAYALVEQMQNMRVMKCSEMEQWCINALIKIENSKELFELVVEEKKEEVQKLLDNENIDLDVDWIEKTSHTTALAQAAIKNNAEIVQLLLKAGANVNIMSIFGNTPLSYVVYRGHIELTKMLLEKGAKNTINSKDDRGNTALWYGVKNAELVKILLAAGADPKETQNILTHAARYGNKEIITMLVEAGAHIDGKNSRGTALIIAAEKGKQEMVKVLLDAEASVSEIDIYGQSALIKASINGNVGIVRMLLEAGADDLQQDNNGWDALTWASDRRNDEVVDILLRLRIEREARIQEYGKIVKPKDQFYYVKAKDLARIKAIAEMIDLNAQEPVTGQTVLHYAVLLHDYQMVRFLLETGRVNMEIRNGSGRTAYDFAKDSGFNDIKKLLEEYLEKKTSGSE